jgi:hypothetical protein
VIKSHGCVQATCRVNRNPDHVVLGSDFDGSTTTGFDASQVAAVRQALLDAGFVEADIRKVTELQRMRIKLRIYNVKAGLPKFGLSDPIFTARRFFCRELMDASASAPSSTLRLQTSTNRALQRPTTPASLPPAIQAVRASLPATPR